MRMENQGSPSAVLTSPCSSTAPSRAVSQLFDQPVLQMHDQRLGQELHDQPPHNFNEQKGSIRMVMNTFRRAHRQSEVRKGVEEATMSSSMS